MDKQEFKRQITEYINEVNRDWHKSFGDFNTVRMVCNSFLIDLDAFLEDKNGTAEAKDWLLGFLQSKVWRVSGWFQSIDLYHNLCFNIYEDYVKFESILSTFRRSKDTAIS